MYRMDAIFYVGNVLVLIFIIWMDVGISLENVTSSDRINTTQLTITVNPDIPNNLTSASNVFCVGKSGFYPDPAKSCAVYYLCSPEGSRVIFECPAGQRFDTTDQACVNATLVPCAEEVNMIKPVTRSNEKRLRSLGPPPDNFAVTSTDFSDWKSVDHLALESDLNAQMTDPSQIVILDDRPITTSMPYSNEYYTQLQSRIGGIFSKMSSSPFVTPVASSSLTVNTVQRSPGAFDCQSRRGYFPDVTQRCNSYYFCDGSGRALKFQCPLDLAFDQNSQACVYPHKAMCAIPQEDNGDVNHKQLNLNNQQSGSMPSQQGMSTSQSFFGNNQVSGTQQTAGGAGNGQQGGFAYGYQTTLPGMSSSQTAVTPSGFGGQTFQSGSASAGGSANFGTSSTNFNNPNSANFGTSSTSFNNPNQQGPAGQQGTFQQSSVGGFQQQGSYGGGQPITASPNSPFTPASNQVNGQGFGSTGSQQFQQPFTQQVGFPAGAPLAGAFQQGIGNQFGAGAQMGFQAGSNAQSAGNQQNVPPPQNQLTGSSQNFLNGNQQPMQPSSVGGYGFGQSQAITGAAPGFGAGGRPVNTGGSQFQNSLGSQSQGQQQTSAFSGGGYGGGMQSGGIPTSGTSFQQIAPPAINSGAMQLTPGNPQQPSFGSQAFQQPPTGPQTFQQTPPGSQTQFPSTFSPQSSRPYQQPPTQSSFQQPFQSPPFQPSTQAGQLQSQRPPQQAQQNTFPTQQQTQQPNYATLSTGGSYGPGVSQQIIQPQPPPPQSPFPSPATPRPVNPIVPQTQPPFATLPGSSYSGVNLRPTSPAAPGAGQLGRDEPPVSPPPAANTTQTIPPMEGVALSDAVVALAVTTTSPTPTEGMVPPIPQIDASCNGLPRGFYPVPGCRKYFYCSTFGERLNYSCQAGKMWHSQRGLCEDEEKVVCSLTAPKDQLQLQADDSLGPPGQINFNCTGRIGNFPDVATGCRVFYRCMTDGKMEKHECAANMLFSKEQAVCVSRELTSCGNELASSTTGETTGFTLPPPSTFVTFPSIAQSSISNALTLCGQLPPGRYANVEDGCRSFWICDESGLDKVQSCPPGLLFDNTVQACDFPQNVDCTNRISNQPSTESGPSIRQNPVPFVTSTMTPTISNFNCAGQAGFFADLTSECRIYHYCGSDGKAYNFTCPSNYRYSEAKQACDVPELTPCETKFIVSQSTQNVMMTIATGSTIPFQMVTSAAEVLPEASHIQAAVIDPAPEDTLQNRWFKFTESPFYNRAESANGWHALQPFNDNVRMGKLRTRQGSLSPVPLMSPATAAPAASAVRSATKTGTDRLKSSSRTRNQNNWDFQNGFFDDNAQRQFLPHQTPNQNVQFSQDSFTPFVRPHLREPGQIVNSEPFVRPHLREPGQLVSSEPFVRPHLREPGQFGNSQLSFFNQQGFRIPDPRVISPNFFENQNFDSSLRTPLNGLPRPMVTDAFPFSPVPQSFQLTNPGFSVLNGPLIQLTPPTPFPPMSRQTESEPIFSQMQDTANRPMQPQFSTAPFPGQFEHFNPNSNFIAHTEFMKQQPMTTFPTQSPFPSFSFEDPASRVEGGFVQTPIITTIAPPVVEILTPPPTTTFRPLVRPIECPLGKLGYFPDHLTQCRKYIFCDGKGGRAEYSCPPGMAFNATLIACDMEVFVQCEQPSELTPFSLIPSVTTPPTNRNACFGRTTGYYAEFASGCREYFYCAPAGVSGFSEKMDFHCPADFLFDEYRGVCVENGQCNMVDKSPVEQLDAAASMNHGVSRLQERFPRQFDLPWSHPNFEGNFQPSLPALPEKQKEDAVVPCREHGRFADFDSGCIGFWSCESPFLFAKFIRCPSGNLFDPISKQCIASYLVQCLPAADQPEKKGQTANAKFSCFGRNPGFHADISDGCRKFHHCTVDGDVFSYTCPFDWIFNEKVGECVQPDNHTCPVFAISKYNDFDCFGKSGYYADFGQHCQVFHLCRLNGSRTTMSCPPAMVFDENEAKCVYGNMCIPPLPPNELFEQSTGGVAAFPRIFECPPGSTGYFGDPLYGCRAYWQCVDGLKLQNRTCPGYLRFNASTEICERPNHVICLDPLMLELVFPGLIRGPFTPDMIPSAPPQQLVSDSFGGFNVVNGLFPKSEVISGMKQFCDPGYFGYYAEVRSNCHIFFHCERDSTKRNYVCPGHMMFNETLMRCQEPGLTACTSTRPRSLFPHNSDIQLDIGFPPSGHVLCRNHVGLVADVATGCRHFLMCHLNGTYFNQSCPGGLLFNEKSSFCEWPFHVRCGESLMAQSNFAPNFAPGNGLVPSVSTDFNLRFGSNVFGNPAGSNPAPRSIAESHGAISDTFMPNKADPTVQFPASRTSSVHSVLEQAPADPFTMTNVKVGSAFFHPGDINPESARSHPGIIVPSFRRHFPETMISSGSHNVNGFPVKHHAKNPGIQPFGPRAIMFENSGMYGPARRKWYPHYTTAGTTTLATTTVAPTTTVAAPVEELEYEPEEGLMPGAVTTAAPAAVTTAAPVSAAARAMPLILDGPLTTPSVLNDALITKPTEPHKSYGVDCYGKRGYFLSPGTGCKSYVFCKPSGALYGFTCPGEYLYNADKEICDWPENVLCLATSSHSVPALPARRWQRSALTSDRQRRATQFSCPYADAYFADVSNNCLSFFYCSANGSISMYDCPDRQLKFDESRGVCDWGKRVKCANETDYAESTQSPVALETFQETSTTFSSTGCPSTGFYADYSTGCRNFYFCGPEGSRLNYTCPDGQRYDEVYEKCTNASVVCNEHKSWKSYGKRVRLVTRTRLISANGESSLDCRNRRGLYADPRSRCFNFFYCSPQGLKFEYSCPENMAFNNALNVCDEPSNSSCSVLP